MLVEARMEAAVGSLIRGVAMPIIKLGLKLHQLSYKLSTQADLKLWKAQQDKLIENGNAVDSANLLTIIADEESDDSPLADARQRTFLGADEVTETQEDLIKHHKESDK